MESVLIIIILAILLALVIALFFNSRKGGDKSQYEEDYQDAVRSLIKSEEQLRQSQLRVDELQGVVQRAQQSEAERSATVMQLTKSCAILQEQLSQREAKVEELQSTIKELKLSEEQLEERLKSQFEVISSKIIEQSREKVNKFNAERMSELIRPFEKEIKEFKEQMTQTNKEQSRERTELEVKIKQMVEISQGMSEEAKNLSRALRGDNKSAGNWGETILENILQNSGLVAGREGYELQSMLRDEEGRPYVNDQGHKMIPDAVVHFPDNRNVIIDSKVSIAAYTDYCNCEDEAEKKLHLKRHIASIKSHVDSLNVKSYERYVDGSLDFVMMFIPNDFAAMVAMQSDLQLWQNAYNKKILIISPTNLITSLKIVSDLWSREKQHQNIEHILERGQFLYEKCCTFLETHKKVGDSLQAAVASYDKASTQLGEKSGIIRQAEMLVESGIKSKKQLAKPKSGE
ncbi:MAG: DNA recombination protein RmuC [Rikenellaceae bacterium]